MNIFEFLTFFSAALLLFAYVPYIRGILIKKEEAGPARTSWLIWLVLDILVALSYFEAGAEEKVVLPIAFGVGALIVFILSIKYGEWVSIKDSIVCFSGSVIGITVWWFFQSAEAGLYCFIGTLILAVWPTWKKVYYRPYSESLLAWTLWFFGSLFAVLALGEFSTWTFAIASIPLAYTVFTVPILVIIIRRRQVILRPKKLKGSL